MSNLESRGIQNFLNDLVADARIEMLISEEVPQVRDEMEARLNSMQGEILEYERRPNILGLNTKWRLSERCPLSYTEMKENSICGNGVTIMSGNMICASFGAQRNWSSGGFKYLEPNESAYAFLKNSGLYISSISLDRTLNEAIYLPKDLFLSKDMILRTR